jgi:hypothetical protein
LELRALEAQQASREARPSAESRTPFRAELATAPTCE